MFSSFYFCEEFVQMRLTYNRIRYLIYAYIGLPVFIFLTFYLRLWFIGIPFAALVITFFVLQRKKASSDIKLDKDAVTLHKGSIIVYAALSVIWTFLGGQGGHYYQSTDWGIRNAIFRDLITRPWPVVYPERGRMLVYYIGHWMTPALLSKGLTITPLSIDAVWTIANQLLWLHTAAGVFIVMLLLLCIVRTDSLKKQILIPLILIGFSGMDILGALLDKFIFHEVAIDPFHIEWWSGFLQFSSTTTCLFWVFNQAVIPWIAVLCLFLEKSPSSYVFLGLCASLAGPIPFMCIFVYMAVLGIRRVIALRNKAVIKEIFDPVNLASVIPLLMVVRFYSTNAAINASGNSLGDVSYSFLWFKINAIPDEVVLRHIILFLLLEAVIYMVLLYATNSRNCMYWTTAAVLMISPFVSMGNQGDFVMRFSVPAVMVMLALCAKALLSDDDKEKTTKILKIILIVCLVIGSVTPMVEFARGFYTTAKTGRINNSFDNVITLDNDDENINFMAYDYKNDDFLRRITGS